MGQAIFSASHRFSSPLYVAWRSNSFKMNGKVILKDKKTVKEIMHLKE